MTDFFSKIFNTNKNNQKKQQLLVDIHSHLIPGIDDGVKTTFEAIKLIQEFEQMGYKKLIITPHITPVQKQFGCHSGKAGVFERCCH